MGSDDLRGVREMGSNVVSEIDPVVTDPNLVPPPPARPPGRAQSGDRTKTSENVTHERGCQMSGRRVSSVRKECVASGDRGKRTEARSGVEQAEERRTGRGAEASEERAEGASQGKRVGRQRVGSTYETRDGGAGDNADPQAHGGTVVPSLLRSPPAV